MFEIPIPLLQWRWPNDWRIIPTKSGLMRLLDTHNKIISHHVLNYSELIYFVQTLKIEPTFHESDIL
jgi:hypothetical protein